MNVEMGMFWKYLFVIRSAAWLDLFWEYKIVNCVQYTSSVSMTNDASVPSPLTLLSHP
jgi:hypothetical protein